MASATSSGKGFGLLLLLCQAQEWRAVPGDPSHMFIQKASLSLWVFREMFDGPFYGVGVRGYLAEWTYKAIFSDSYKDLCASNKLSGLWT